MSTFDEMLLVYLKGYERRSIGDSFERAVVAQLDEIQKGVPNPKQFFSDLMRQATPDLRVISYAVRNGFPQKDENDRSIFVSEFDRSQGRIRYDCLKEDQTRYYYIQGSRNQVYELEVEYRERD